MQTHNLSALLSSQVQYFQVRFSLASKVRFGLASIS